MKEYLVNKGIAADCIVAKGYGDRNPVAVNMTATGRAKNNRTALKVVSYTGGSSGGSSGDDDSE